MITLDSHCDTPMFFDRGIDFASRDKKILVDLHKMTEGRLDATIMVAYLKQSERTDEALPAATAKADRILNEIEEMVAKNCTAVDLAYTSNDLWRLKMEGKKAIMLGIENGYAIGKDISNVERFRKRGVVYMTLCHNGNNDICGSARDNAEGLGVSAFGEDVIKEMNRVGMMVDISHAGEKSFYDALEISTKPIVASHSSARALCDHPRNLTDAQLKALAAKGGVAQVTLYDGFLRKEGHATIKDAINHLNHMVNIMGIEHVGIGTDFDGDGGITGCASASELINFTRQLLLERYSEESIRLFKENKNILTILFLMLVLTVISCGNSNKKSDRIDAVEKEVVKAPEFNADSAYAYVGAQADFGPRVPNTKAHEECGEYLAQQLEKFGAKVYNQRADLIAWERSRIFK